MQGINVQSRKRSLRFKFDFRRDPVLQKAKLHLHSNLREMESRQKAFSIAEPVIQSAVLAALRERIELATPGVRAIGLSAFVAALVSAGSVFAGFIFVLLSGLIDGLVAATDPTTGLITGTSTQVVTELTSRLTGALGTALFVVILFPLAIWQVGTWADEKRAVSSAWLSVYIEILAARESSATPRFAKRFAGFFRGS